MHDEPIQFVLELTRRGGGALLGRAPFEVDWGPVREALTFELVRRGDMDDFGEQPLIRIAPRCVQRGGDRVVQEIIASASLPGKPPAELCISIDYFRARAKRIADGFVEAGALKAGDCFEYRVLAKDRPGNGAGARPRICVETVLPPVNIRAASLDDMMGRAILLGTGIEEDIAVFVHWKLLEEASVLTRRAGELETGGILVGKVLRDRETREVFLEVTAQIPAKAKSQLTRLSFRPDTWSDAQLALDLRANGEVWLGWWHSHSFLKQAESTDDAHETIGERSARPFLSEEDHHLHRTVFPRAFSLALLLTDSPQQGMCWTMFGWRAAQIAGRDFHVIHAPMPESFTSLRGEHHAANR